MKQKEVEVLLGMIGIPMSGMTDEQRKAFRKAILYVEGVATGPTLQALYVDGVTGEASSGSKVPAIKALRAVTGLGLKEAKDVIDATCCDGAPLIVTDDEAVIEAYKAEFKAHGLEIYSRLD